MADHIRAMQAYVVCKKIDEIRRLKSSYNTNDKDTDMDTNLEINNPNQQSSPKPPCPFLLCGDLNSDPLSGAAQLLFTRTLRPEHHDCWKNLNEYKWDCGQSDFMVEHGYIGNEVGVTELKYEEEAFDDAQEQIQGGEECDQIMENANTDGDENENKKKKRPCPPIITLPSTFPNLISGCLEMPKFTNYAVDFIDTLDYVLASESSEDEPFGFKQIRSAPMPTEEDVKKYVAMPNECMPSDHVAIICDLEWKKIP